jgi:hypothetical protein
VCFFSIYFNYVVHAPQVRCQCDAVVLIKIVILCFFSFPFILIMRVPRPYTGKMSVCDAVVN